MAQDKRGPSSFTWSKAAAVVGMVYLAELHPDTFHMVLELLDERRRLQAPFASVVDADFTDPPCSSPEHRN